MFSRPDLTENHFVKVSGNSNFVISATAQFVKQPPTSTEEAGFVLKMGRVFLEHFGGSKLFSCKECNTFLTNRDQLMSSRFTGATGRAILFAKAVNLNYR